MSENNQSLESLLKQSIAAQNKTTHAVRSLANFVLLQSLFAVFGGIPIGLSFAMSTYSSERATALILGIAIVVIGFITALITSIRSLKASAL